MSISRPSAALSLEGAGAPSLLGGVLSLAQGGVARVRVDLSVDEAHDRVELWLWRDSPLAGAEPGAALSVGLGSSADDVTDVLGTEVGGRGATEWGTVLTAYAATHRLGSTYVGRSYVDQSLAGVVEDLLGEAEVDAGDIDASLQLPVLHVDPSRSAWATLHRLAARTGHQVTTTPAGAVSFTPLPGATGGGGALGALAGAAASALGIGTTSELREGAELLAFRTETHTAVAAPAVVTPSAGTGPRWHLLAADPDTGIGAPVLVQPAWRTREAADAATASLAARAGRRARTASVSVPGRPDLRAGATVTARGERYRVLRARHVLDRSGYVCTLALEAVA